MYFISINVFQWSLFIDAHLIAWSVLEQQLFHFVWPEFELYGKDSAIFFYQAKVGLILYGMKSFAWLKVCQAH